MPKMTVVERDYRKIHEKFTSIGPCWKKSATAVRAWLENRPRSGRAAQPEQNRGQKAWAGQPKAGHGD